MQKAYDLKALAEKLKKAGLPVAEKAAGEVYKAVKAWIKESAALSENKFDDVAAPFIDQLDAIVLPQVDKISEEPLNV